MIQVLQVVDMSDDVYEVFFYAPALHLSFVKLTRDTNGFIADLIASGVAAPEIDEANIGWTEEDGRKERDFFAGVEPPEDYETMSFSAAQQMTDRLEIWCQVRGVTMERLIVSFLKFIVQPENEAWTRRFLLSKTEECPVNNGNGS